LQLYTGKETAAEGKDKNINLNADEKNPLGHSNFCLFTAS
jgi:hypothetical protein